MLARYILRELLWPLGAWLAFLFLLLFVMQVLRSPEVLLGSAVTAVDLARLIAYLSPHFLVMAVPIAFLLSLLLGLGRLSEDRELTALQALGVGPWQLLRAPLLVGVGLALVMVWLSSTLQPWGLTSLKALVEEVIKKNVVSDVKAGVFYDDLSRLTLYAEKVDPDARRWTHVLIHDDRDPRAPLLVLARSGRVAAEARSAALELRLFEGEVHRADRTSADYSVVTFERGELNVGVAENVSRRNRLRSLKEEMTPFELVRAAREAEQEGQDPRPFWMFLYSRLGNALAPLSFAVLGTPLAIGRRQQGRARGFLLTFGGYIVFYLLGRLFESWALRGAMPTLVAGLLANVLFVVLGLAAMYRLGRTGSTR